jgi:hypothetical protein
MGCAAASMQNQTMPSAPPPAQPLPAMEYSMDDTASELPADAVRQGKAQGPASGEQDGTANQSQVGNRMIVYTGLLSLQVNDTAETVNRVEAILQSVNGYIANKSLVEYGENKLRGTIQIRLPAASLNSTLPAIKALGVKVLKETQDSNDVTAEYTDLDARRKNLEAYEVELQKLLETVRERTGKAEDILAVYNQLTQVRGEIEQIKGRQNYLENTSTLATYTIEFVPVEEVIVEGTPGWDPGNTTRVALDNLVATLQRLADVAIVFFINVVPVLLILLIPILVFFLIVRAIVRRRTTKKAVPAS